MKISILFLFYVLLLHWQNDILAQEVNRKSLDITLYTQNFAIVHDLRSIELKEGIDEIIIGDLPHNLNPETVYTEFNGRLLEQSYMFSTGNWSEDTFRKLEGEEIRLISEYGEVVEGTLLSHQYGQLWLKDRNEQYILISSTADYRLQTGIKPDVLRFPQLAWTVESEQSGTQDVSVYYQTNGMRWTADYLLILDEDEEKMNLEGRATITNQSGMEYPDARIRLVAGDLNVERRDIPMARATMEYADMESGYSVDPDSFFEYHVFELPERTTLADNEQKQITLFRAPEIRAQKFYHYTTGAFGQLRRNNNNRVQVEYRLTNNEDDQLGRPLPAGLVKVYQKSDGLMEFIGEDRIAHTPVEEDFTISVGRAFDVTVEEKQTRLAELSNRVREEDREITVTNQKEQDIIVEVNLQLHQRQELRGSSIQPREVEARRYIFQVPVEASSQTTLTLQLRQSN